MSQHHPLNYESPPPTPPFQRRLGVALVLSAALGLLWTLGLASLLDGPMAVDALRPSMLLAGLLAGTVAGLSTIRSRLKRAGREAFFAGLANYYLALATFWAVLVFVERVHMCIRQGGWTDFDLHDHLILLFGIALYGTIPFGLLLLPLCFLSRHLVWYAYASPLHHRGS